MFFETDFRNQEYKFSEFFINFPFSSISIRHSLQKKNNFSDHIEKLLKCLKLVSLGNQKKFTLNLINSCTQSQAGTKEYIVLVLKLIISQIGDILF